MAKAQKKKAAPRAKKEDGASAQQVTTVLEPPVNDPERKPREDEIGKRERRGPKEDINAQEEGEDRVFSVASRARWGSPESTKELMDDARKAEDSAADNREE
jgi:hypothetical protein